KPAALDCVFPALRRFKEILERSEQEGAKSTFVGGRPGLAHWIAARIRVKNLADFAGNASTSLANGPSTPNAERRTPNGRQSPATTQGLPSEPTAMASTSRPFHRPCSRFE